MFSLIQILAALYITLYIHSGTVSFYVLLVALFRQMTEWWNISSQFVLAPDGYPDLGASGVEDGVSERGQSHTEHRCRGSELPPPETPLRAQI